MNIIEIISFIGMGLLVVTGVFILAFIGMCVWLLAPTMAYVIRDWWRDCKKGDK